MGGEEAGWELMLIFLVLHHCRHIQYPINTQKLQLQRILLSNCFCAEGGRKKHRERERKLRNSHRLARVQLIRGMQALPCPQATFQRDSKHLVQDQHSNPYFLGGFAGNLNVKLLRLCVGHLYFMVWLL